MKAFNDDLGVQLKYLNEVRAITNLNLSGGSNDFDQISDICQSLDATNETSFALEVGIPAWLMELQDTIYNHLPTDLAKTWPVRFLDAIQVGSNLNDVKVPFTIFLLDQNLKSLDTLKMFSQSAEESELLDRVYIITEQTLVSHKYSPSLLEMTMDMAYSAAKSAITNEGEMGSASVRASRYAYSAAYSVTSPTQSLIIGNEARSFLSSDPEAATSVVDQSEALLKLMSECVRK
jgi:hypothetical protein